MSRSCPTLTFHPSMSGTTSFSDKFQLEMSCKSYYLVVNITGNKKNKINRLLKHWFEGYVWIYASVPHWKTHIPRKWYKSVFLAITFEVYNRFWKLMTLWIQYQNTQCFKQEKDTNSWGFNCKNEKNCKTSVWDIVWKTTLTFFRW